MLGSIFARRLKKLNLVFPTLTFDPYLTMGLGVVCAAALAVGGEGGRRLCRNLRKRAVAQEGSSGFQIWSNRNARFSTPSLPKHLKNHPAGFGAAFGRDFGGDSDPPSKI